MYYLYFYASRVFLASFFFLFLVSCKNPKSRVIQSPPHYSFKNVLSAKLDRRLLEVSGITWNPEKNYFLAHNDEEGILFILDKDLKGIVREYKFAGKGDYEDVALYNNEPYILRSDGVIIKVIIDSAGNSVKGETVAKLDIGGTNDFESMYADTSRGALVVICKNCKNDDKNTVSAFAYYPETGEFPNEPVYTIDADDVNELTPHKTSKFQPSAAAIHPILKKLFIVASASKQLVIADLRGNVEGVYELGKKLFPQPEGLTFKNNGDMYISNEGVNAKGTVLKFVYMP